MAVFQLYPKRRVRQKLDNDTIEFEKFFFSHVFSSLVTQPLATFPARLHGPQWPKYQAKKAA
jgi:hypothetical protein